MKLNDYVINVLQNIKGLHKNLVMKDWVNVVSELLSLVNFKQSESKC